MDDKNIIQTVDYKVNYSWHCGDGKGAYGITNRNSVGVEICINPDSNYEVAYQNAIELAVYLLKENGLGIERLKRHYDASRKNCPQTMNNSGDWSKWNAFVAKVKALLNPPAPAAKLVEPKVELKKEEVKVEQWKLDAVEFLADKGIIQDREGWKVKVNEPAPVWLVMVLAVKIVKLILK